MILYWEQYKEHSWFPFVRAYLRSFSGHFWRWLDGDEYSLFDYVLLISQCGTEHWCISLPCTVPNVIPMHSVWLLCDGVQLDVKGEPQNMCLTSPAGFHSSNCTCNENLCITLCSCWCVVHCPALLLSWCALCTALVVVHSVHLVHCVHCVHCSCVVAAN